MRSLLQLLLTPFRAAYNQTRLKIELIRQAQNRLLEKAKEHVANQRKHKFYKRWRHEMRYRGPPVKIAPGPLAFNPALAGRVVARRPPVAHPWSKDADKSKREVENCRCVKKRALWSYQIRTAVGHKLKSSMSRRSQQFCSSAPLVKVLCILQLFAYSFKKTNSNHLKFAILTEIHLWLWFCTRNL